MQSKKKRSHYNTNLPNPTDKKKEEIEPITKFVVGEWENYDSHWANKFNDFEKYYDRWIGKPPKRDEDWQANFHKRLTWQAEKTLVARFHSVLFPISAPIDTEATETPNEFQRILAKSLVAHWFKIGKFSKEFLSGMRSAGIYGTGLFEDDWYVRKEQITERTEKEIPDYRPLVDVNGAKITDEDGNIKAEQIGMKKILQEQSRLKVVEDRYRVRKANIFAWRIHPNKLDDDDDYSAIKQEFITFDDLLERQAEAEKYGFAKFDNMDKVEQDKFKVNEEDAKRLQKDGEYIDDKNPRLELLHFYGLYAEKEGAQKKPMWITVANRKYKLWVRDNPFWHKKPPLFHIVWTEDEKPSYYGIGLAQIGADAEDRANTWVNIRTDVKKKNIRGSGWYNSNDKKIKKSQLTNNTPGLLRACSDPNNAVKYDNPPPVDPTDYSEEQTAVNDHREITGASSALLPTENQKNRPDTLGGMQQDLGQALAKLKPDLSMMEIMGIRKMADRALLLSRQFMTQNEAIELLASQDQLKQLNLQKIYTMTPKELMGSVRFFCTGLSESLEKMQNIDKALKFMEMLQKFTPGHPFVNYLIKKIALWLNFEDAATYFDNMAIGSGLPQGLPPGAQGGVMLPQGVPQSIPQGQPPIPAQMLPMVRPPMPAMPQGGGQNLPPALIQMIVQRMMMQRQGMPANQGGMV